MKDANSISKLELDDESILVESRSLFLGGAKKFMCNRLCNNGTVSDANYKEMPNTAHH